MEATTEQSKTQQAEADNGELSKRQREMLELDVEIIQQNQTVKDAKSKWMEAKEELSRKAKVFAEEQEKLSQLVDDLETVQSGKARQERMDFDEAAHPDITAGKDRPVGNPAMEAAAKIHKQNATPLADVKVEIDGHDTKFTAGQIDALATVKTQNDTGIATIGELEDLLVIDNWWEQVPGIGQAQAEKIERIVRAFCGMADAEAEQEPEAVEA